MGNETQDESTPALRLHHLRPAPGARRPKLRYGRGEGGKGGKTAGRGTKGTHARNKVPVRFEGGQTPIHMRLPKRRGVGNPARGVPFQVVNLDKLAENFEADTQVGAVELVAKGLVRPGHPVKVLGTGEINVALNITADAVSASAKEKIEAAGGSVTVA